MRRLRVRPAGPAVERNAEGDPGGPPSRRAGLYPGRPVLTPRHPQSDNRTSWDLPFTRARVVRLGLIPQPAAHQSAGRIQKRQSLMDWTRLRIPSTFKQVRRRAARPLRLPWPGSSKTRSSSQRRRRRTFYLPRKCGSPLPVDRVETHCSDHPYLDRPSTKKKGDRWHRKVDLDDGGRCVDYGRWCRAQSRCAAANFGHKKESPKDVH